MQEGIETLAARHAHALLGLLGLGTRPTVASDHSALGWRRAGLMAMTGRADGPGLIAPVGLTSAADGALAALKSLAPDAVLPQCGALLLGERARLLGLSRRGATSPNGSCRLLATRDGCIALNLPRADDWDLMPALFGVPAEGWAEVARLVAERPCAELMGRGVLLGLAIAAADRPAQPTQPFTIGRLGDERIRDGPPLVVDLSSLWAGPLAGSLLHAAGARVIKVESSRRPDGARAGHGGFYDLLNSGKESVALDFADIEDVRHLRRLIEAADIVIEGSRPRALAGLGISAERAAMQGATWVSITAHGRVGEAAERIGFGDDTAVAGGLSAVMAEAWGEPLAAGDAIADPLTGITAALAGWAGWMQGGGRLVSLALADVVGHACSLYEARQPELGAWQALAEADAAPLYPLRTCAGQARPLGADTGSVLAAFA